MKKETLHINGTSFEIYSFNTVVVGSGAAGLNAADRLYSFGQKDIAVVTEGLNMGTSLNTGSDKQTYYKLTLAGSTQDSVYEMAKTLYDGGSMHGDIALVEAALSAQSFYRLVDIGVPFPHNSFGEYIGYKTDHDPRQRATSAGPLTSKYMTEKLKQQVFQKGIGIFDGYQVIAILTDKEKTKSVGLLTLNNNALEDESKRFVIFNCTNIIYATGGPAGMYQMSVYPESQTGATGIAFEAGVKGKNLTESQYGIASIKFRWNLSGTYQQVIPRYVSTDKEGKDEKEFLDDYFSDTGKMLDAIFLKGYQWPFDPRKVCDFSSSLIDILVYNETVNKGRRVFLDFTKNPSRAVKDGKFDFSLLGEESYTYLKKSNALFGTPIDRLALMNQPAIDLYKNNGIDITEEYLEIAVCAQHNNGGLYGDIWWESNLKHLFPVGEVNGSHGVYRPGGSALNSGQVGSTRAAQFIAARYTEEPLKTDEFIDMTANQIYEKISFGAKLLKNMSDKNNIIQIRRQIGERMTRAGAHIRSGKAAEAAAKEAKKMLESLPDISKLSSVRDLPFAYQNRDLLITQYVYLSAIANYIEKGGGSRGSYLVYNKDGKLPIENLPEEFRFTLDGGRLEKEIQEVSFSDGECRFEWNEVKPIPESDDWFENVWNAYMRDEIIR
ncbi:MAG: succinate dehydrogenase flavoprotein subunit [Firmicutes bacterium ADurb.Bin193]|nr:MAG: succinate dehydrogenase flavoprotein subunit [Firmicutes bacterium ADurb.Bin193]